MEVTHDDGIHDVGPCPHLAHGDPVDGRLPSELLNKLSLLLELLHFSFVRKHLQQSTNDFNVTNYKSSFHPPINL